VNSYSLTAFNAGQMFFRQDIEMFFIGPAEVADIGISNGKCRLADVHVCFMEKAIGLLDPETLKILEDRNSVKAAKPLLEFIHV